VGGSAARRAVHTLEVRPWNLATTILRRGPWPADRLCRGAAPPCRGDVSRQLFSAIERFSLLRRLGVESVWVAHQGRRVDSSLLLEVGALTTNRLIAVAEALADRSFTRQSFLT